ncbi:degenerin unc-8-like [Pollicipes pollicipes]|uniref:degenerin unc-8-like n=1 Tax=Pollicipes pollicipes TaxID=41117 RepID=UPI0018852969|nr:degenerin unc-8-like [Pollicipes pollicipes]
MATLCTLPYACLVLLSAVLLARQCYELVLLYASEPTASIRSRTPADRWPLPDFTVCPSTRLRGDVLRAWGMLADHGRWEDWYSFPANATLDQLWQEAAVDLDKLVPECYRGFCTPPGSRGGVALIGRWTSSAQKRGTCYTYRSNLTMNDGVYMAIFIAHNAQHVLADSEPFVDLFLHGEQDPVVEAEERFIVAHPSIRLRSGERLELLVRGHMEEASSLRRRPCVADCGYSRAHCRQRCVRRRQAELIGCRAPWMPGPQEETCRSLRQVLATVVPPEVSFPYVRHTCHCPLECRRETWTTEELRRDTLEAAVQNNWSYVTLKWAEVVHVTTEQLTYGSSSLISDIGGTVGMLFGFSVLSLVQMLEAWLKKLLRKSTAGKRATVKQTSMWSTRKAVAPGAESEAKGAWSRGPAVNVEGVHNQ